MYLLKDNIVNGKEDDEIIKGEKIFWKLWKYKWIRMVT